VAAVARGEEGQVALVAEREAEEHVWRPCLHAQLMLIALVPRLVVLMVRPLENAVAKVQQQEVGQVTVF
jgi:hypothetical protein